MATGVVAQDFSAMDMTGMGIYAMEGATSDAAGQSARVVQGQRSRIPEARQANLKFTTSPQRRRANLRSFVDKARAENADAGRNLEQILGSVDVVGEMEKALQPFGLGGGDVSDAYTAWWINAWDAANGESTTVTKGLARAVKRQSATALLAIPEIVNASEEEKQSFSEALLVQAVLLDESNQKFRNDRQFGPKLRAATRQGAQKMGLDLTAMDLTEDGFIMREGASAAERQAVPGEEPETLAAAGVGDDAGEGLKAYDLPALGGAAALGAVFLLGRAAGRRG